MAVRVVPAGLAAPARVFALGAATPWVAALFAASAVLRIAGGWLRATPVYLPDEYMYSELGRSLAESGRPLVRGVEAHFPALLQPVLTAPFWLIDDVEIAYRLVQAFGAVAMSLAVPIAYLLARRVGLGRGVAVAAAAVAIAVPDLVYTGWLVAEPFAYPLVLGAVLAGVSALSAPRRRTQLLFVALAGLAMLGRAQFAVLPLCFVAAALVVGGRERRLRALLREQALPLALFALPLLLLLVRGKDAVLGIYSAPGGLQTGPVTLLQRSGPDALVLLYAAGWLIVPGAILGLVLAIARPRSTAELAFGALTVALAAALLLQAALFGAVDSVQERYFFYVVPLLAIAFGLHGGRGFPHRRLHLVLVVGLLTLSARFPLSEWAAADGKEHSPVLLGVARLEQLLGSPGAGSLAVAGVAAVLCAAALAVAASPRRGTPIALALAAASGAALWAGALTFDARNADNVARVYLSPDRGWVDRAGLRDVAVLRSAGSLRIDSLQLFWNRSVNRVLLLPGAERLDPFTNEQLAIGPDGTLLLAGRPVRSPLLVDDYNVTVRLTGARKAGSSPIHTLWRPEGTPRLSMYLLGRYHDGWLASAGGINLWPAPGERRLAGVFTMRLTAPVKSGQVTMRFDMPDGSRRRVLLEPGVAQVVRIPVCAAGAWKVPYSSSVRGFLAGRVVSARSSRPVFRKDASVCPEARV